MISQFDLDAKQYDYHEIYNHYWKQPDRFGQSFFSDPDVIATEILKLCGSGSILDVGCGMGVLVRELLSQGINAHGMDISDYVIQYSKQINNERYIVGSLLDIPWKDNAFETIICTDVLMHLKKEDIHNALKELHRVTRRFVYCTISTQIDREGKYHLTIEDRNWWENQFFLAGFRRHSLMIRQLGYESLGNESGTIRIILEKIPLEANSLYPLSILKEERDLHMDMLRESGRRSDAHVARYSAALNYIRPNDIVLDAACGMGYGSAILWDGSKASQVIGVDLSSFAVEYSAANFLNDRPGLSYLHDDAHHLKHFEPGSIDVIVSMETIEHLYNPSLFLQRAKELLRPGGRIILSVPNEWVDENGSDPNPHHLHVFDYFKIRELVENYFYIEKVFGQIAGGGMKLTNGPRTWFERAKQGDNNDAEWWVIVAMKDPVTKDQEYIETVQWKNSTYPDNHHRYEKAYEFPWIQHAFVTIGMRADSKELLKRLGDRIVQKSLPASADRGAALCVKGYQLLQQNVPNPDEVKDTINDLDEYTSNIPNTPMQVRWAISCSYLLAQLYLKSGQIAQATEAFKKCISYDFSLFSPTLATKTVGAALQLGIFALIDKDIKQARQWWKKAVEEATRAFQIPWEKWWGTIEEPFTFSLKEASNVLDLSSQAAYGLWLTFDEKSIRTNSIQDILSFSHQSELAWYKLEHNRLIKTQKWVLEEKSNISQEKEWYKKEHNRLLEAHNWFADQVEKFKNETTMLSKEREEVLQENHKLIKEKQELTDQIERYDHEKEDLFNQIETLQNETTRLSKEQEEILQENHKLIKEKQELTDQIERYDHEKEDLFNQIETLQNETTRLSKEQEEVLQENHKLIKEKQELTDQKERYVHEKEDLINQKQELLDKIHKLIDDKQQYLQETLIMVQENTVLNKELMWFKDEHQRLLIAHDWLVQEKAKLEQGAEGLNSFILTDNESYKAMKHITDELTLVVQSRSYKIGRIFSILKNISWKQRGILLANVFRKLMGINVTIGLHENNPVLNLSKDCQNILWKMESELLNLRESPVQIIQAHQKSIAEKNIPMVSQDIGDKLLTPVLPLVSVLLPVYNHSNVLEEAVSSVQKQDYLNWELIVLDDGSKDDIDSVLKKFKDDSRIRIYRQENQKLPNSLTNLHELAKGEFITWTSADNIMAPKMLTTLVKNLMQDPMIVLVYADVALIDENGNPMVSSGYRDHNRDYVNHHILRLPRTTKALGAEQDNYLNACFMYKAWASQAVGNNYAHDLNGLEDYDFWLRLKRVGKTKHVKNNEPLYFYRVHKNTMSHELVKEDMQGHLSRAELLIKYDQERETWVNTRWNIKIDQSISYDKELLKLLELLPVNINGSNDKIITFTQNNNPKNDFPTVLCKDDFYLLLLKDGKEIKVPRGCDISPLALKARRQKNPVGTSAFSKNNYVAAIGCHLSLNGIDADETAQIVKQNSHLFFVFVDTPGSSGEKQYKKIQQQCNNTTYLGQREFGTSYWVYADLDAVWVPPMIEDKTCYYEQGLVLVCAIARYFLYPDDIKTTETVPYAIPYKKKDSLPAVWQIKSIKENEELLDTHLCWFSCKGRLERLLNIANASMQETFINRPDFGQIAEKKRKPVLYDSFQENDKNSGWVGLWVDVLDKGGLEEVIAILAENMLKAGVAIKILCSVSGGTVADRLIDKGIPVYVFDNNRRRFSDFLKEDKPILLNTHFAKKMLDVAYELDIPIIETIHNMYAHFDSEMWQEERERSKYFKHLIAVSEVVKNYYLKWHGQITQSKITVISNAIDPSRTLGLDRETARSILGIGTDEFVLLNLASFDGRKNQLGLMTAFDRFASINPDVTMLCVGNALSQFYYDEVIRYYQQLQNKPRIKILDFMSDVGSLFGAADVFLIPSYIEGWSISASEAIAAGLPLIHTDCGSGRELCGEDRGILISNPGGDPYLLDQNKLFTMMQNPVPPNTEELISAMGQIYSKKEEWKENRIKIRNSALNLLSINKMVNYYIRLFNQY